MKKQKSQIISGFMPWFLWVLATSFYFFAYLIQVSPSVMRPELIETFSLNAATFGLLSAFFFYAYAGMQFPAGILFDTFGTKKVLISASMICSLGCILFYIAPTSDLIYLGRVLIGLGCGFAALGCFHTIHEWFPNDYFPMLTGCTFTIAMLGAAFGQTPLAILIHHIGWRGGFLILTIFSIVMTLLMCLFLRNKPKSVQQAPLQLTDLVKKLKRIVISRVNWITAFCGGFLFVGIPSFAGLWGVDFIEKSYGLSTDKAAGITSLAFVGFAVGAPVLGWLTNRFVRRKPLVYSSIIMLLLVACFIIYYSNLPLFVLSVLFFLLGFFSSGVVVTITIMKELNEHDDCATAIGFKNTLNSFLSTVPQPLIGVMLDILARGHMGQSLSVPAFRIALSMIPVFFVVSLFLALWVPETGRSI